MLEGLETIDWANLHFYYNYYEYRYQREKLKERDQQRMDWAHQSHEAVLQGVPLYLALLQHEDKQIREVAAYVLSFCFERVTTILPNLQMQADAEHDPVTKATMITAIHHICKVTTQQGGDLPLTQKERASYLQMCLASNREPIVQLVSALALVDLGNLDSVEQLLEIFALAGAELADEFPSSLRHGRFGGLREILRIHCPSFSMPSVTNLRWAVSMSPLPALVNWVAMRKRLYPRCVSLLNLPIGQRTSEPAGQSIPTSGCKRLRSGR